MAKMYSHGGSAKDNNINKIIAGAKKGAEVIKAAKQAEEKKKSAQGNTYPQESQGQVQGEIPQTQRVLNSPPTPTYYMNPTGIPEAGGIRSLEKQLYGDRKSIRPVQVDTPQSKKVLPYLPPNNQGAAYKHDTYEDIPQTQRMLQRYSDKWFLKEEQEARERERARKEKAEIDQMLQDMQEEADAKVAALEEEIERLKPNVENAMDRYALSGRHDLAATEYEAISFREKKIEELKQQKAEMQRLMEENYYHYLYLNEDWSGYSRYRSTDNGKDVEYSPFGNVITETGFDDVTYDYINGNKDAISVSNTIDTLNNSYFLGLDKTYLTQMTRDEVKNYNYLYHAQGKEQADEYLSFINFDLTKKQREQEEEEFRERARENPVSESVFSILTSPLKTLSYMGQLADYFDDGRIDQNAAYNRHAYRNSAVRGEVSEIVKDRWGEVGSTVYQIGMGMGDYLVDFALSGGNKGIITAIMASGAAVDTTIEAKDRGLDDDQAFLLGTIAGATEIIAEKIDLDLLLDCIPYGKDGVGYVIKNALSGGVEEGASSFISTMADVLVSQDNSRWNAAIREYINRGYTEDEAFRQAFIDQAQSIGLDALTGAIVSGSMATAMSVADGLSKKAMDTGDLDPYRDAVDAIASDLDLGDLDDADLLQDAADALAADSYDSASAPGGNPASESVARTFLAYDLTGKLMDSGAYDSLESIINSSPENLGQYSDGTLTSYISEHLFTDPEAIQMIADRDIELAKSVSNDIAGLAVGIRDPQETAYLQKAKALYEQAIQDSQQKIDANAQITQNSLEIDNEVWYNKTDKTELASDKADVASNDRRAKRIAQLRKNAAQGRAFEILKFSEFLAIANEAVEQITIITYQGVRIRVDAIGIDKITGEILIQEYKSSQNAPPTKNQKRAFAQLKNGGGRVVGKGKGIFTEGYEIPAGIVVDVVRPEP